MHDQHVQARDYLRAVRQARFVERLKRDHDGTYATAAAIQRAERSRDAIRSRLAPPRLAAINPDHR
jgi:tRNA nucleotidyltransferase/poly(A) polymerase